MAFDVGEEYAEKAIEAARTLGICGMNVTMPCKKGGGAGSGYSFAAAEATGAVNTIKRRQKAVGTYDGRRGFCKESCRKRVKIRGGILC